MIGRRFRRHLVHYGCKQLVFYGRKLLVQYRVQNDKRRRRPALPEAGTIVRSGDATPQELREALAPYIDLRELRRIAASATLSLHEALISGTAPAEVRAVLDVLATLLRPIDRERIQSPQDVAGLLMVEMSTLPQEQLRVLVLNAKNMVVDAVTVYQGTVSASPVRPAEVFRPAIVANAASIVVVHCHPSGDPTPSPEDVATTAALVRAGELLGIEVLDHIIIGRGTFISLKERSLGF